MPCEAVLNGDGDAHSEAPAEPENAVTAESVALRASKMFAVGASAAAASDLPRLTSHATKALVQLAAAHMDAFQDSGNPGALQSVWQL